MDTATPEEESLNGHGPDIHFAEEMICKHLISIYGADVKKYMAGVPPETEQQLSSAIRDYYAAVYKNFINSFLNSREGG